MSFIRSSFTEQKTLNDDYSISALDIYGTYICNATKTITIDLPPAANCYGKEILFKQLTNRRVIIDGNSSETIDGDLEIYLSGQYSFLKIACDGSSWFVKSYQDYIDSGWISCSDWTNRHLGTVEVDYDNLSGTPILGETVVCSGGIAPTGIIYDIIDGGGGTGTLKLLFVTNQGLFGNNLTLTFSVSGATALVNEPTGSNQNIDTNIFHNYSRNLSNNFLTISLFISSDSTENNSFRLMDFCDAGSTYGYQVNQIDSNNLKIQTRINGAGSIMDDSGTAVPLDTENWFYKILINITINKG
jgi:hypothetical protein